jgi:hypothetical protein
VRSDIANLRIFLLETQLTLAKNFMMRRKKRKMMTTRRRRPRKRNLTTPM